jgi:hypothetical protein
VKSIEVINLLSYIRTWPSGSTPGHKPNPAKREGLRKMCEDWDYPKMITGHICSDGVFFERLAEANLHEVKIDLADITAEMCIDGEYSVTEAIIGIADLDMLKRYALALENLIAAKSVVENDN